MARTADLANIWREAAEKMA